MQKPFARVPIYLSLRIFDNEIGFDPVDRTSANVPMESGTMVRDPYSNVPDHENTMFDTESDVEYDGTISDGEISDEADPEDAMVNTASTLQP